jgi:hypothetical protein
MNLDAINQNIDSPAGKGDHVSLPLTRLNSRKGKRRLSVQFPVDSELPMQSTLAQSMPQALKIRHWSSVNIRH